ncbi:MAG: arylsulfatase A-like enzyme [Chlamydiales bacterium]
MLSLLEFLYNPLTWAQPSVPVALAHEMNSATRPSPARLIRALPFLLLLLACGEADPADQADPEVAPAARVHAQDQGNVLLILVDDMGFDDLGCFGGSSGLTPNIDSLARDGVTFERAYVTASICSPSRAGLLSGRYQQRFGHENNTGPLARQLELGIGLPPSQPLLSERLRDLGHATALIGKWHLGAADRFHPLERGFDEFFGHLSGGHTYIDWEDPKNGPIYRGREPVSEGEYLTDALSTEAVEFIGRNHERPFFLLLSYNALHEPFEAPELYLQRHAGIADRSERVYAAMISALDDGIGRVLAALDLHGLREDTLVCFLSDNGPRRGKAGEGAGQLRGGKLSLYEGGLRVPLVVRWPARISAGGTVATPVSSLDLVPTCLAAAGRPALATDGLDGHSLLEVARAASEGLPVAARTLFWRQGGKAAVSDGQAKLVRRRDGSFEAYDLDADPAEAHSLDGGEQRFMDLKTALTAWEQELALPAWDWSGGRSGG